MPADELSVRYLQDVLVHPDGQRTGVGRALVCAVLEPYAAVRQKVLLTDDEPASEPFTNLWVTGSAESTVPGLCGRS